MQETMNNYEREHLQVVKNAAAECTLFLKRDDSFPLDHAGKIAAYGAGVRNTVKGGTGSGEVNSRFYITIEQGLQNAGFSITSQTWLDAYEQVKKEKFQEFVKELKSEAKKEHQNFMLYCMGKSMPEPEYDIPLQGEGDVAVYVLSRNSGEGADRQPVKGDILLSDTEVRDILALNKKYKKFMLILNVGGVVDLTPVQAVNNILLLSQLGVVTGEVLANILLGKENPSGCLTTTWSAWNDYARIGTFGDADETRYKEGIYVGYRYFDAVQKKPLFPFGYGLSYADFSISNEGICMEDGRIFVHAKVKNISKYAGKQVVQVYLSAPQGRLDKPYQELACFGKTQKLEPGEEEILVMDFCLATMASYDEQLAAYILEAGDYVLRMGKNSLDTQPIVVLQLPETTVVRQTGNCLGKPDFEDWRPLPIDREEDLKDVFHITLTSHMIGKHHNFQPRVYEIDKRIPHLTDSELVAMNIGAFDPKGGALSVIGNAAMHVAGAAGETTSVNERHHIGALIMADGPAGLRLSKEYYKDEKGAHTIGNTFMPASLEPFLNGPAKFLLKILSKGQKSPKGATVLEQYATAIPIGTALAQSFNLPMVEALGDMVGAEMQRFGVNLWLAPALNIHRSILCGRNFEYYSEDPILSGLMAAAMTNGVQRHKGCGTTIKHYAANNQELNRDANNSQVSERAMREIYLRGFGICVYQAKPKAVMTSYNLLNGIHTAEHRGLIDQILRQEYGFDGLVMTDWVVNEMRSGNEKYRNSLPSMVALAGGDLFMPGKKADFDELLQALQDGKISREQLQINASRIARLWDEV